MKNKFLIALIIILGGMNILPVFSLAASQAKFYYGGWMPYWKKAPGAQEVALNLEKLDEISPFSYEVKSNGALVDKLKIATDDFWISWLSAVRASRTKIIPTIAWFDGPAIHKLLSNKKSRIAHENAITKLVKDNKFDGIDIDYESKLAETKQYFSLLIEGLAIRLHPLGKKLSCTVEPRAPLESLTAKGIPTDNLQRANDYAVLNKYCDEVRLMAYDQGTVDPLLNDLKGRDQFYAPVADPEWVKKVLRETTIAINPKKIMLGIPTYGYEYKIIKDGSEALYDRRRTYTYEQAILLAGSFGVVPQRNNAGELSFTYATTTIDQASGLPTSSLRFVSVSDAAAAADKIKIAKTYGLRGVYFFKIDGEADPALWNKIK